MAKPLSKTPPPVLGPDGTQGTLHCERSPVSMSADQITVPGRRGEEDTLDGFEDVKGKKSTGKARPISLSKPTAKTRSPIDTSISFVRLMTRALLIGSQATSALRGNSSASKPNRTFCKLSRLPLPLIPPAR